MLYYKIFLPIKLIDVNYLNECISFELRIEGKVSKLLTLYRSPSQNRDEFETFLDYVELNFDHMVGKNPYLMVALGEFNAKSNSWYRNDSTDTEGSKIDILTSTFGFHQIINILLFNETVLNIIFNFIPYEAVTYDDRDPPWITSCIKKTTIKISHLNASWRTKVLLVTIVI